MERRLEPLTLMYASCGVHDSVNWLHHPISGNRIVFTLTAPSCHSHDCFGKCLHRLLITPITSVACVSPSKFTATFKLLLSPDPTWRSSLHVHPHIFPLLAPISLLHVEPRRRSRAPSACRSPDGRTTSRGPLVPYSSASLRMMRLNSSAVMVSVLQLGSGQHAVERLEDRLAEVLLHAGGVRLSGSAFRCEEITYSKRGAHIEHCRSLSLDTKSPMERGVLGHLVAFEKSVIVGRTWQGLHGTYFLNTYSSLLLCGPRASTQVSYPPARRA